MNILGGYEMGKDLSNVVVEFGELTDEFQMIELSFRGAIFYIER